MPSLGLACCFPITTAVVHPQPTTRALHLCQIGLRAVMGLKQQPGPNSIAIHRCQELRPGRQSQIRERACEFTPVLASHLRKGELFQQGFSFAALMQGDLALHQPPAEIHLRRLKYSVIQRATLTRTISPLKPMTKRPRAARELVICSTRICDAMAQQLQVDCNVVSTDNLVLRAVRCRH